MVTEANISGLGNLPEVEKKVARLEGAYEHLATKADLEKLRSDLTWRMFIGMGIYLGLIVAYMEWRVVG